MRRLVLCLTVPLAVVAVAGTAAAYWTRAGSGSGTAVVSVRNPPAGASATGAAGASAATPGAAGNCVSGQAGTSLSTSATSFAQATQGSATSSVFSFSTPSL